MFIARDAPRLEVYSLEVEGETKQRLPSRKSPGAIRGPAQAACGVRTRALD